MSRCPKSDAAANNGYIEDLYKVSADFEMKLTAAHAEIAELRAKCERLEAVVRAEYLFTLGKLSREDEYLLGKDLAELGTTDSAKAAYKSANPGGVHE